MPNKSTFAELLAEATERVALLSANLPSVVDPTSVSIKAKIPTKVLCCREALIWRTEELARAACEQYRQESIAAAITLTRAAIEGVAATWYLKANLEKVMRAKAIGSFDDKIMSLLIGSKNDVSEINAINVMNFIDSVEKEFGGFRRSYESLCEYSHPNWSGTSLLYSRIDHAMVRTEFGRNKRSSDIARRCGLPTLIAALEIYSEAYNAIGDLLPAFVLFCEADLGGPA